jgi:hypothetical protein
MTHTEPAVHGDGDIEAVHTTERVQNDELPVASFIDALMAVRQLVVHELIAA